MDMKICVLGSGTWGTAISNLLGGYGHEVRCLSHFEDEARALNETHKHPNLPRADISKRVIFSADSSWCVSEAEVIVFATPSSYIRETAMKIKEYYGGQLIVDLSKGIEEGSLLTTSEIIEDVLGVPNEVVALTGPSHAEEVSLALPTCIVAASPNKENAKRVQRIFHSDIFRVYTNEDRKGCELCGAFKNIIAIACGISDGLGYGDNAKAALITRGVHELSKLGMAMDCSPTTFSGLAGVGDLIVTCTSVHSRNNRAGHYIGSGLSVEKAIEKVGMVVEGINALPAAKELCDRHHIDMPIVYAVYQIVYGKKDPRLVSNALLGRDKKDEFFI